MGNGGLNQAPKRILIVDDNEALRKITRKVLEAAGYQVWEAADGAAAVTLAKEGPDMVLQDLVLPDITGYDLVHKLRAACGDPRLPVLAFSSFMEKPDTEWDTSAGFNALVVKPVDAKELLETIRKHMR
jgi:CheY-like chemotaxis protein